MVQALLDSVPEQSSVRAPDMRLRPDANRQRLLEKMDDDSLLGQFIPLHYHGQMLSHEARMGAFQEAITRLVPEGGSVLELGAGTGVMSFFAAQRAERVTCVERIPHVAAAARTFLRTNGVADKVTVVEDDAVHYVPERPVDVVICEMLHVGLLREKQVQVLRAFKRRYLEKFGGPLPVFIPEATFLAVQAVTQNFEFHGYQAPIPLFYEPTMESDRTTGLGEPEIYAAFEYAGDIPVRLQLDRTVPITETGTLNALRFITKNLVGIFPQEGRSADWFMQYLVLPLPEPFEVTAGQQVRVTFKYDAGDSLLGLSNSLTVAPEQARRSEIVSAPSSR